MPKNGKKRFETALNPDNTDEHAQQGCCDGHRGRSIQPVHGFLRRLLSFIA